MQESVMLILNQSKNRAIPSQITAKMESVRADHAKATVLSDVLASKPRAGSVAKLALNIETEFYASEDMDRPAREVTGVTATNFSRMQFLDTGASEGLRQVYGTTTGSTFEVIRSAATVVDLDEEKQRQLALAIEALFEAAQFGSGRACRSLIEANEQGVIELSAQEIRDLVMAQMYWYQESRNVNDLKATQCLPALIKNPKAWTAVREDAACFRRLLEVAYFNSGVDCQSLIEANEAGTIELTAQELQELVNVQLDRFVAAKQGDANASHYAQQVPTLLVNPKAWAAVRQSPDLYKKVLEVVYHNSGVTCQELINANETGVIVLEPKELVDLVKVQIDQYLASKQAGSIASAYEQQVPSLNSPKVRAAMQQHSKESYENLLSFFNALTLELPNAATVATPEALALTAENNPMVFKGFFEDRASQIAIQSQTLSEEDRALSAARINVLRAMMELAPQVFADANTAVLNMRPLIANKIASNEAADAVAKEKIRKAEKHAKRDNDADVKTVTISYPREGLDRFASKTLNTETLDVALDKVEKNPTVQKYKDRIANAKTQPDYVAFQSRVAAREQAIVTLKAEEAAAAVERENALQALQTQKTELKTALAINNPLEKCVLLGFAAAMQELVIYGTQKTWSTLIVQMLTEILKAINEGKFRALCEGENGFTPATLLSSKKPIESLPVMLMNSRALMKMLEIFMLNQNPEIFWENMRDQFLAPNGRVADINVVSLLTKFPLDPSATVVDEAKINEAVASYTVAGHVDPLLAMFNNNMLLALFVSIKQIFPAHNAEYSMIRSETEATCRRLSKIVARPYTGAPSRLRNYIQVALAAMLDKPALKKLLAKDASNPWYGILLDKGVVQEGDFVCGMASFLNTDEISVRAALTQLANTQETAITMADTNNGYDLLAYMKAKIAEAKVGTEVDYLVIECLCYAIHARYMEYCTTHGAAKPNTNPIHHTNAAVKKREERKALALAADVNTATRRSSVTSDASPKHVSTGSVSSPVVVEAATPPAVVEEQVQQDSVAPVVGSTKTPSPELVAPASPKAQVTVVPANTPVPPARVSTPVVTVDVAKEEVQVARVNLFAEIKAKNTEIDNSVVSTSSTEVVAAASVEVPAEVKAPARMDMNLMAALHKGTKLKAVASSAEEASIEANVTTSSSVADSTKSAPVAVNYSHQRASGTPLFLAGLTNHALKPSDNKVVRADGHMSVAIPKKDIKKAGGMMGFLAQGLDDKFKDKKKDDSDSDNSNRSSRSNSFS